MLKSIETNRNFLKAHDWAKTPDIVTDQQKKIPAPPLQKHYPKDAQLIDLIPCEKLILGNISLIDAIKHRKSRRGFVKDPLTLEELSFLLWVTQGIREIVEDRRHGARTTKRTVPSGGSRHPYETYLIINRVQSLQPGIYRYLALEHKLYFKTGVSPDLSDRINEACYNQSFIGKSAVIFIWTTIPYRTEWRYSVAAHKDIAIEAGHICQNLYLGCEAIGAGTCAIAAYDQNKVDSILNIDGNDEFTVYIAPVGKIRKKNR
ncbi:MAG: SagB/ThcOx family dehydrogenase [Candidatus Hodarchaeota archaeon]